MKALVTGATGFIGSHLADELVRRGYMVTCLVRKTSDLRWMEGLEVSRICGDCEEEASLERLAPDFDYVFHLAGLTKAKREEDFFCANAKGTENLLRAVSANVPSLKRFVYLSSLSAVGPSGNGLALDEMKEPNPVSSYGRSKREGEQVSLRYKDTLPVTIIRPPAVYGPRDRDFYLFFKMLKRGFYPDWGKCYYSLLYVDDLVTGMIMAAEAPGAVGGIYFLSDGMVYSNEDIANAIVQVLNTKALRLRIPKTVMNLLIGISERLSSEVSIINRDKLKELSHSHWVCDSGKAARELGFIPKVMIKEGMKWTVDWYRIHQWL
jgi:nucleoside-diphosphate-sugar epimerase